MNENKTIVDSEVKIARILGYDRIDGVVPGVRGQRAFPTQQTGPQDPFIMLDHIGPDKLPVGFRVDGQMHPHRGFETITFMFEGNMQHSDTLGTKATLTSGSVQIMNAGKGISHGGDMTADVNTRRFHEVQLWVNSPARYKMTEPSVQTLSPDEIPVTELNGAIVRVIAGKAFGLQGPANTFANITVVHISVDSKSDLTLPIPENHELAFIYLLQGEEIQVDQQTVRTYQTAIFNADQTEIELHLKQCQLLFLTGRKLDEPISMGGPFVMNTEAEIELAYADYRNGNF